MNWTATELGELAQQFESRSTEEVLRWGVDTFFPKIGLASSFGAEDVALIHLLVQINPSVTVFTLDTGRLPEETYHLMDQLREKYHIQITSYFPNTQAVQQLEREKGFYSFRQSVENRKECCAIRKVEPLSRALSGLDAWITGLRREQAVTRKVLPKVELDTAHQNIVKINPMADWTTEKVWDFIRRTKIPYNRLHDMNYPSIGCAPCTRAIQPGEDIRAGRWWWELPEQKECGLHIKPKSAFNKEEGT